MVKSTSIKRAIGIALASVCVASPAIAGGVNSLDKDGKTPVMTSMEKWRLGNDLSQITSMVMSDAFNPYISDRQGRTAYDYSVMYGVKPVEYALAKYEYKQAIYGGEITTFTDIAAGGKALIRIVSIGDMAALRKFVEMNPNFNLDYEAGAGITPLAATTLIKNVDVAGEVFNYLVDSGANPNHKIKKLGGDTASHIFVASDNYLMLLLSISRGYDIHLLNDEGQDVLGFAKKNNAAFSEAYLIKIITSDGKVL